MDHAASLRATRGSHCSPVRPRMGQNDTATEAPTATTASTAPASVGRDRSNTTPADSPTATEAIWPPRHPAMTPRRSNGGKR